MYESFRKRKWASNRDTGLFGGSDDDVRPGAFSVEDMASHPIVLRVVSRSLLVVR